MTNRRISDLPASPYRSDLLVPTVDLTQPSGSRNAQIAMSALAAAIGMNTVSVSTTGLVVPNGLRGATTNILAYQLTDPSNTSNAMLLSVEFSIQTNIGTLFNYAIYNGNPASGGSLIAQNPVPILTTSNNMSIIAYTTEPGMIFSNSATGFILNSALLAGIYVQITNLTSSGFSFDAAFDFLLVPSGSAAPLPVYVPPTFSYTGPSNLTTVEIGVGQTFTEMADALPYMSTTTPWTMNVHPGIYYKPMVIGPAYTGFTIQAAAGASADTITCNGRGGYFTGLIYDYNDWSGNAPYSGTGPKNPFRLAQGKGFFVVQCAGTVEGIGFLDCGGGYSFASPNGYGRFGNFVDANGVSHPPEDNGGEAAIYIINSASSGGAFTVNINRCTFDGGANGVFVPSYVNPGGTTVSNVGNLTLNIDHCDFSTNVPCGNVDDGLSHNCYISALYVNATNSNFYGCLANSFKSRSPNVTITNCFMESWCGRCIDWPEGGHLTVSNTTFTQKFVAGVTTSTNYIGLADENTNGMVFVGGAVPAQFTNCALNIGRYETMFLTLFGQTAVFTAPTQTFFPNIGSNGGANSGACGLIYDTLSGSTTGSVSGLYFGNTSDQSIAPATNSTATSMPTRRPPMHNTP